MAAPSAEVVSLPDMDDLVTARLILHPMTVEEAEKVIAGKPDPSTDWAPGYPDVSGARGFLDVCTKTGDPQPFGTYQIRLRATGYTIGGVGFRGPASASGTVTIGYGLAPEARGRGYASEALREILSFARTHGITCVEGDTTHDNVASQHVMTAAGMQMVAEDERLKYYKIVWVRTTAVTDPRS